MKCINFRLFKRFKGLFTQIYMRPRGMQTQVERFKKHVYTSTESHFGGPGHISTTCILQLMLLDASLTSMSATQDVILVRVTGCQLTSSVRQADWITHCVISIWFTVMQISLFLALLPAMVSSRCL